IDGEVIEEMPVNSVITRPADGFETGQPLGVGGYAWSGRSRIGQVGVSVDGGASWREAVLGEQPGGRFAWRRFDIELAELPPGPVEIIVRAHDHDSEQPLQSRRRAGNPIGYCNNVARRVRGRVV
ncbi:MAG TPA: hypothetical protein VN838_30375, partial [Bradyrhizobium sp.]|nr:hypothetical protein [Bradyrhizobium sp.]